MPEKLSPRCNIWMMTVVLIRSFLAISAGLEKVSLAAASFTFTFILLPFRKHHLVLIFTELENHRAMGASRVTIPTSIAID